MMGHSITKYLLLISSITIGSCVHEPMVVSTPGGYPDAVADIIINKCATTGCHNNSSYIAAAGLNLTTWNDLFNGSRSGAVVIPYGADFSPLLFFTNTDTAAGVALSPTMPVGMPALSKEEYATLKSWIEAGAPDDKGKIKFSDNPARRKFYVTNRQCEVVTVIDAETLLPMRYVSTGNSSGARFPFGVKVSPDKKHFYVSFFSPAGVVQKFSAEEDRWLADINLTSGVWTSFALTRDSRYGFFADNSSPGKIAYVDLAANELLAVYNYNFIYPSGIIINEQLHKLYVGAGSGNFIYEIDITDPLTPAISELPIDGSGTIQHNTLLDPVELLLEKGTNRCYIACAASQEIRVMDMEQGTLLGVIPLGAAPAYMTFAQNKLFVTCPDDEATFPGNRGSVAIIDASTNTIIKKINSGYQPYGIVVDEQRQVVAVVNANISSAGPGSHHSSRCGEKNGNVSFIDLNTLTLKHIQRELVVFPFGIDVR